MPPVSNLSQKELASRRARAWKLTRKAAALLKEKYGASEVLVCSMNTAAERGS